MRNIETKVTFNGETRAVELSDSFQTLYQQVAKAFGIERFILMYRDEEGDLITVATDAELQHAYTYPGHLQLEVYLSSAPVLQHPLGSQQVFVPVPTAPEQQPFLAAPQYAPVLYPAVQQYPAPVSGFPQSPVPVPGFQQFAPANYEIDGNKEHGTKCGKKAHKEEREEDKAARRAEKAQQKGERKQEKIQKEMNKLHSRMSDMALAPATAVQLGDVNVVMVPLTPVFPPAPPTVWTKTPSGVFYSQAEPRPHGFEIHPNFVGVVPPVPYYYTIEFMDPAKRVLMPGDHFMQRWRVRNEGTYAWPAGVMLMSDPCKKHGIANFSAPNYLTLDRPLGPKEEVVLTLGLVVPPAPGRYVGRWKMCTPDLWKFGQKIKIVVKAPTPENAEKMMQKAIKKANLSREEKKAFKDAKRAAKLEAKQLYREAKMQAKQGGDKQAFKEAKKQAKEVCKSAKKQAKLAHKDAKMARKEAITVGASW